MTDNRWRILRLDVTASTNDDVRLAAEAGEPEGLVIVASEQLSGRGRQGRVWESQRGNLYCSVLLRPSNMPQDAGLYSFVAAVAVHEAVRSILPHVPVTLKWPNDVLVKGKKISGILLEVAGDALIVGIGLNVAHCPNNTLYPTTSLAAAGAVEKVELPDLLDTLLQTLAYWHDVVQHQGFLTVRAAWLEHAQLGAMTVRLPHETLQGILNGINENGHLRLLLEDGTERVISTGDVFFAPRD